MMRVGLAAMVFGLGVASCGVSHPGEDAPDAQELDAEADTPLADAGDVVDTTMPCTLAEHCSDGDWCNGEERCGPGLPGADSRGCLVPELPACPDMACDPFERTCRPGCFGPEDEDDDGFANRTCGGNDCNDLDRSVHPGASDVCNGRNDDCDARVDEEPDIAWYVDRDGDGHGWHTSIEFPPIWACAPIAGRVTSSDDCTDEDAAFHPGAPESCDGRDTDCNSLLDAPDEDDDGDGVADARCFLGDLPDCNDEDATIHPRATEVLCDGVDQDCDGLLYEDDDDDGVPAAPCGGFDCNDRDPTVGAPPDADGDGHITVLCGGDDCDDTRAEVFGGAPELCDRRDTSCTQFYPTVPTEDLDEDGYAPIDASCVDGVPGSLPRTDCIDSASTFEPGRPEICDGLDNDCDSATADGSAVDNDCLPGHSCREGACRQTVALAAGVEHMCALIADRSVRCWGGPGLGCAEPNFDGGCNRPFGAFGWRDIVAVDSSASIALDASGRLWSRTGLISAGPPGIAVNSAGCVVRADTHTVWCADLGDLVGPSDVVQLEDGCARTSAGELWCWGPNDTGQVGDGTTIARTSPVRVIDTGVTDVASSSSAHCAVLTGGTVLCWGANSAHPLYTDDTSTAVLLPSPVPIADGALEVAGSEESFAVVRLGRNVFRFDCVARFAGCPNGSTTEPGAMLGTVGLTSLVISRDTACALTADRAVACFGYDGYGRLGAPYVWSSPMARAQPVIVGGL